MRGTGDSYLESLRAFLNCPYDAILTEQQMNDLGVPPERHAAYQSGQFLQSFAVGSWYNLLSTDHTFRTVQTPLSFAEGAAIRAARRAPDASSLDSLRARIQTILTENFPGGAFLKLDTRSPKDIPYSKINPYRESPDRDRFLSLFNDELKKLWKSGAEFDVNNTMIAFQSAATAFLKVESADDVIGLLLRSVRIFEDINGALEAGEEYFSCSLVFREWDPRIPSRQQYEFRGFVFNRKLNALTQYHDYLFFPEIVARKDEIERQIRDYFEQIHDRLPHQHYLIDFVICSDREIKVIELNPLTTCAGSGLFDWQRDIEVIKNGPFEFRVRTEPDPRVRELAGDPWIRYCSEYADRLAKEESNCLLL